MSKLTILRYPDPRLHTVARPVAQVDDRIRRLIDDMFETMYAAPGIGLAATQVNVHKRLVVMDLSEDKSAPLVFINPEFTVLCEELEQYQEGCLSVPGFYDKVERAETVMVTALDRDPVPLLLLRPEDFPLDASRAFMRDVKQSLDDGPGFAIVDLASA